jgi:hypothetical protein
MDPKPEQVLEQVYAVGIRGRNLIFSLRQYAIVFLAEVRAIGTIIIKVKVKMCMCLIKDRDMKTY